MAQLTLDTRSRRMLLADWFGRLAAEAGLDLSQRGTSGNAFTLGSPTSFNVRAEFIENDPYLRFLPSHSQHDALIDTVANEAVSRVAATDLGGEVWYSTELHELAWSMASPQFMGTLLQRLGSQTRITGWRRLGGGVLLEFTEEEATSTEGKAGLLAPKAIVKVHVAAPGPMPGHFASYIAHGIVETVGSICTFALGRPVALPHVVFPANPETCSALAERRADQAVLTLARKGVRLDIMGWASQDGGFPVFGRLRSALLTFDAAVKQEHDAIASILYVVAAECLTTPLESWRKDKPNKRFKEFYDQLMPDALDTIVGHANFEEAFGIQRGSRTPRALRRETLDRIYSYRSGQLHEGLNPTYRGLAIDPITYVCRGLFYDFAEAAILRFIQSPCSSLIGHPLYTEETDA